MTQTSAPPCLMTAWQQHEHEIYGWLLKQSGSPMDADDLLQETFLRAIRQQDKFCAIENARAWLFEVARHLVIDRSRRQRPMFQIHDELIMQQSELDAVDSLVGCLPRVLEKLAQADRDILRNCDLGGMKQADYAAQYGLTLAATKSRLLRARERLRQQLSLDCQVRLDNTGRVCCFTPAVK